MQYNLILDSRQVYASDVEAHFLVLKDIVSDINGESMRQLATELWNGVEFIDFNLIDIK